MDFKQKIEKVLKKELKLKTVVLEVPPDSKLGDYAFPCFFLAKKLKKSPVEIAKDLANKINVKDVKIINNNAYVNFFVDKEKVAGDVVNRILKEKGKFGVQSKKDFTVMIESPAPNTNKPLHLGHVRNMVLANALVNLFTVVGNKTIRVDVVNDRGIHICQSMIAYQKWGKNKLPNKKPDHFVGDFYVMYNKKLKEHPELEIEIKEMLKKWEENDIKVRTLWKKMNSWALDGIKETYKRYGVKMDKPYYESDHFTKGRKIVKDGLKQGIFEKDEDDNIIIDLEKEKLGKKVLLRADGTSIYITQDLALGKLRYKDYKMNQLIYVVANEQTYHFKVLFEIFKQLKFPLKCYHLAYGMVYLPEGKMKSREGTVVDADELADSMKEIAKKEIVKRHKDLEKKELEKRAEQIGMGAIKFFMLKFDPMRDFTYNPKEAIAFEGETGPYVQYAYARICSILRKFGEKVGKADLSVLNNEHEQKLIMMLGNYENVIKNAVEHYKPSLVCRYLLDLAQLFNEYYHACVILKEKKKIRDGRLVLITVIKQVIKNGLGLLGIEAPEQM